MPIYEYECLTCGEIHEETKPFVECNRDSICPRCGSPARKIISRTAKPKTGFTDPIRPGVDYPGPMGEEESLDDLYRGSKFRDGKDGAESSQEALAKRKDTLKECGFGECRPLGCEPEKKIIVGGK